MEKRVEKFVSKTKIEAAYGPTGLILMGFRGDMVHKYFRRWNIAQGFNGGFKSGMVSD